MFKLKSSWKILLVVLIFIFPVFFISGVPSAVAQTNTTIQVCVPSSTECTGLSQAACNQLHFSCEYKAISKVVEGRTYTAEACFPKVIDRCSSSDISSCHALVGCTGLELTTYSVPEEPKPSEVTEFIVPITSSANSSGSENEIPKAPSTPFPKLTNPLASSDSPQALIGKIINVAMGVVGSLALIMFILGGISWMTAGGNEEKVRKSMGMIVWSMLGLIVVFLSYALVKFLLKEII